MGLHGAIVAQLHATNRCNDAIVGCMRLDAFSHRMHRVLNVVVTLKS